MTPSELQAIEARANAATPGPWRRTDKQTAERSVVIICHNDGSALVCADLDGRPVAAYEDDFTFIAHARTDVPALIAEVRRLEACLARVNAAMERVEFDLYARINALEAENERLQAAAASVGDDLSVHPTSAYARKARELK